MKLFQVSKNRVLLIYRYRLTVGHITVAASWRDMTELAEKLNEMAYLWARYKISRREIGIDTTTSFHYEGTYR